MLSIYILELSENKFYVGKTLNLEKRLQQHSNGEGSEWTKKYKFVKLLEQIKDADDFDEDKYVLKYMAKYGIDNVRGGSYCMITLPVEQRVELERKIRGATNCCFKCGESGHFASVCGTKTNKISGGIQFVTCYKCKQKGHYANACPLLKPRQNIVSLEQSEETLLEEDECCTCLKWFSL